MEQPLEAPAEVRRLLVDVLDHAGAGAQPGPSADPRPIDVLDLAPALVEEPRQGHVRFPFPAGARPRARRHLAQLARQHRGRRDRLLQRVEHALRDHRIELEDASAGQVRKALAHVALEATARDAGDRRVDAVEAELRAMLSYEVEDEAGRFPLEEP